MALEHSIFIKGIQEELKETEQRICDKIHHALSKIMQGDTDEIKLLTAKRITIKSFRRLGRFSKYRTRPISVELYHKQEIEFILENKFNLDQGIYVDRKYPLDVECKQKILLPVLRAAKRSNEYKKQSRLEDDKIVLKGRSYSVNTLNQLPEELNVFKVTTRENEHSVGFFGEINPLSNFYPSAFALDRVHYISSEQFIQSSKAKFFGDMDMYNQIMGCTTSLDCKTLTRQIKNVDVNRWEEVACSVCKAGIRAKFLQNPQAMDTLLHKTGQKQIAECTADRLWGTGLPLGDPACLDTSKWISQGIMGQILESIHDALHYSQSLSSSSVVSIHLHDLTAEETNSFKSRVANQLLSNTPVGSAIFTTLESACSTESNNNTIDSASASTTPVSDTTASGSNPGETQLKIPVTEHETVQMEESAPI